MGLNETLSRNMEDVVAVSNLNCEDLAHDISEMLHRDCFCSILLKSVTAFFPCLKSLLVAKVKRFILILLTKEVSQKAQQRLCSHEENILKKHSKLRKEKYKTWFEC